MVDAVESIPRQLLKDKKVISRYVDNIALEARSVDSDTFLGITCSSYVPLNRQGVYLEDSFSCTGHGNRSDEPPHGKVSTSVYRQSIEIVEYSVTYSDSYGWKGDLRKWPCEIRYDGWAYSCVGEK